MHAWLRRRPSNSMLIFKKIEVCQFLNNLRKNWNMTSLLEYLHDRGIPLFNFRINYWLLSCRRFYQKYKAKELADLVVNQKYKAPVMQA